MATERWISPQTRTPEEEALAFSLRPARLDEYVGQSDLVERLRIAIHSHPTAERPLIKRDSVTIRQSA